MAQVSVEVNGRPYVIGCEDGQEKRLTELAATVDAQIRQVGLRALASSWFKPVPVLTDSGAAKSSIAARQSFTARCLS